MVPVPPVVPNPDPAIDPVILPDPTTEADPTAPAAPAVTGDAVDSVTVGSGTPRALASTGTNAAVIGSVAAGALFAGLLALIWARRSRHQGAAARIPRR